MRVLHYHIQAHLHVHGISCELLFAMVVELLIIYEQMPHEGVCYQHLAHTKGTTPVHVTRIFSLLLAFFKVLL